MLVGRLFTALMVLAPSAVFAQEAETPAEPTYFAVEGLAAEDLLNVRATASPAGMLIGRLGNGAVVRNLGCAQVKKYHWCKVADLDNDKVQGWVAQRYLKPTEGPPQDDIGPVGEELDPE